MFVYLSVGARTCLFDERAKWTRFTLARTLLREWLKDFTSGLQSLFPSFSLSLSHTLFHPGTCETFDFSLYERINSPNFHAVSCGNIALHFSSSLTLSSERELFFPALLRWSIRSFACCLPACRRFARRNCDAWLTRNERNCANGKKKSFLSALNINASSVRV